MLLYLGLVRSIIGKLVILVLFYFLLDVTLLLLLANCPDTIEAKLGISGVDGDEKIFIGLEREVSIKKTMQSIQCSAD